MSHLFQITFDLQCIVGLIMFEVDLCNLFFLRLSFNSYNCINHDSIDLVNSGHNEVMTNIKERKMHFKVHFLVQKILK